MKNKGEYMTWKKHKNIMIFLLISVIGIALYIFDSDGLGWQTISLIATATSLALAVLALLAYFEYAKGEDNIKIYFKTQKVPKIYTKLYTQRKHFTRGEVLGLLGMIYNGKTRFELKDFNKNTKILERFKEIQDGLTDELIIEVSEEELKQFNVLM